jgi:hypothetical protein
MGALAAVLGLIGLIGLALPLRRRRIWKNCKT